MTIQADIAAIFARQDWTAKQRLDAFLALRGDGKRGVGRLRERQGLARQRLNGITAAPPCQPRYIRVTEWHNRRNLPNRVRWDRRAKAQGHDDAALELAEWFHDEVQSLYTSRRASIVYGRGGQEGEDRDAYSKTYNRQYGGARWKNAGAYVDYPEGKPVAVVQNHLGNTQFILPLPPDGADLTDWAIDHNIVPKTVKAATKRILEVAGRGRGELLVDRPR